MSLESLRERLAELDGELLRAAAERQRISFEIGRLKRELGLPPRDFQQEKVVVQRARALAGQLGLAADLAESLLLTLIRSSLTVQERDSVVHHGVGSGRSALVIGGAGKMGRWFVRFLDSQGFAVEVADPAGPLSGFPHASDWRDSGLAHDLIVLAAPLRVSGAILHELATASPPGLVFDIGSVKGPLRSGLIAMAEAGLHVTSLHPMFGPDTELLSGRHIVFVDVGVREATAEAKGLFASTMAIQVDLDLESHDRVMAFVLGLSHALNIAFASALAESGETAPALARLSSTTFDEQLRVTEKVAGENPHLYFEIQSLNPYGTESLAALLYAVERLRATVRAGDEPAFVELMSRGRDYIEGRRARNSG
ncbi:MAG: prephenate dehydrogenase/arogenate dehydrogenase family protein [Planctomycetota bacterium]